MMNSPASSLAQAGRYLLALPLALGLTIGGGTLLAPATAAPVATTTTAPGPSVYYLDGKLSNKAAVEALNSKDIAYLNVLKEETARQVFGKATGGAVIVVTKANQNSAEVLALKEKIDHVAPMKPAAPGSKRVGAAPAMPVPYLAAPALAYITKNYPDARLRTMTEIPAVGSGSSRQFALPGRNSHGPTPKLLVV